MRPLPSAPYSQTISLPPGRKALRAASIDVWFDQSELRGGDVWDAAIRRQIKTCALIIPVISANTQERAEGYFRLEWKLAVDRSHLMAADKAFLVPVVIDGVRDDDARVIAAGLAEEFTPDEFVAFKAFMIIFSH